MPRALLDDIADYENNKTALAQAVDGATVSDEYTATYNAAESVQNDALAEAIFGKVVKSNEKAVHLILKDNRVIEYPFSDGRYRCNKFEFIAQTESGIKTYNMLIKEQDSLEDYIAYTKLLYRRMNVRGVVRADFLLCDGEVYFNEMNTVPGSLAWYLFCDKLADFSQVLSALIEQGICEYREMAGKTLLKNSGVLGNFSGGGKRRG